MQRRVAFAYLAFFLVIGASAFSVLAVAEEPDVSIEGETLETGSSFQVDDQQYTVTNLELAAEEGGEGEEGGEQSYAGTLEYTNDSYLFTETLENGSTVEYRDGEFRVEIPNGSDPGAFQLTEQFDIESILANDSDVDDEIYTAEDGTEFVRYANDTTQPLAEYLAEPRTEQFATGDEIGYQNRTTTVASVTPDAVTLEYVDSRTNEIELAEGENVTLSGQQYFATFQGEGDNVRVTLAPADSQYDDYQRQLERVDYFHERTNGLWGVVILSGFAAILVISLALMPVKG